MRINAETLASRLNKSQAAVVNSASLAHITVLITNAWNGIVARVETEAGSILSGISEAIFSAPVLASSNN